MSVCVELDVGDRQASGFSSLLSFPPIDTVAVFTWGFVLPETELVWRPPRVPALGSALARPRSSCFIWLGLRE